MQIHRDIQMQTNRPISTKLSFKNRKESNYPLKQKQRFTEKNLHNDGLTDKDEIHSVWIFHENCLH